MGGADRFVGCGGGAQLMGVAYRFVGCGGYSKWEELIDL